MIAAALAILVVGIVAADYLRSVPPDVSATYVGRENCTACHQSETERFIGSHHDKAMDLATDETVLGDFEDATIEHDGMVSRMFRDGDKFMVHTDGPDGNMQDFEIKYVFGVHPLQQYMVEFDREPSMQAHEIGRLQVLRISWDAIDKKWFYLRPPDVDDKLLPDDPLHWTGIAQRWQTMCAVCHSTDLKTNFDPKKNVYHTTFSEIDVSCEACHGPGSLHIELANRKSLFWDRHLGYGLAKLKGDDPEPQLQTCAPCHSRRSELNDTFQAGEQFCNHYQLEVMRDATYHADGQIKDEVYVYGSFIQSRMYHQGIRCTDCHDPHSLELKHKGNETCTSCHQHAAGKYDVPSHHHHAVGTEGAKCVNCHMPHTTYMAIDKRRDHSLRVPRPDLSVKLGTPNACSSCHVEDQLKNLDEKTKQSLAGKEYADWLARAKAGNESIANAIAATDAWCDEACETWYGKDRKTPKHFAETIVAFRNGEPGSLADMLTAALSTPSGDSAVPNIARASMLSEVAQGLGQRMELTDAIVDTIRNAGDDPLVRASAIDVLASSGSSQTVSVLLEALRDDIILVRIAAAQAIVNRGIYGALSGNDKLVADRVIDSDLKESLEMSSDRSGSHLAWAMIEEQRGNYSQAITSYQTAIRVEPHMAGGRTNLAALLENLAPRQSESQAQVMVQRAKQLRAEELPLLARDSKLAPDNPSLQYRYGLALYLAGQMDAALESLNRAVELAPDVPEFIQARDLLKEKLDE
ncbi:Tetratricopeptide repeat protein [Rubripirellula amarantea]|uniref:Tetratricopeptide repeat protein n=2 Tax=Rubripirellula amarantea TaxID=2527999 RepID=A0A5C5WGC3_9BACT|nr:Tetratricopeptide repeat protein [Rubripirellula amarantea]